MGTGVYPVPVDLNLPIGFNLRKLRIEKIGIISRSMYEDKVTGLIQQKCSFR